MLELDEAAEDGLPANVGASKEARTVAVLRAEGRLSEARDFLKSSFWASDEELAMLFLKTLLEMEDYEALIAALKLAVDAAQKASVASGAYLGGLISLCEEHCLPYPVQRRVQTRALALAPTDGDMRVAISAARRRRLMARQRTDTKRPIALISLGLNCLLWQISNRWGYRTADQLVHHFNPFCRARHKLEGVLEALDTDFAAYADPAQMIVVPTPSAQTIVARTDRKVIWNHNRGAYWVRDHYKNLVSNLTIGIENFRRSCREGTPIFFVGHTRLEYPEGQFGFLDLLNESLARYTGNNKNYIVVVNQIPKPRTTELHRIDDTTYFFYRPFPDKDYVWHRPSVFNSEVGLNYEYSYFQHLSHILIGWGLMAPEPDRVLVP